MHTINKQLVFGLLLVLTAAGCAVKTECEITCADGFKTTENDECEDEVTVAQSAVFSLVRVIVRSALLAIRKSPPR